MSSARAARTPAAAATKAVAPSRAIRTSAAASATKRRVWTATPRPAGRRGSGRRSTRANRNGPRPARRPRQERRRARRRSLPVHPSPGDPQARRRAQHDERRGEEDSGLQHPVEPAADEDAEQDRRDDRPAEHADLAEARGDGRLGIVAELPIPLRGDAAPPSRSCRCACRAARSWRGLARERQCRRRPTAGRRAAGTHQLTERARMQPQLLDLGAPVGVELGCALQPRRPPRAWSRSSPSGPATAGDGDAVSPADRQHAAAQRAVARRRAGARPAQRPTAAARSGDRRGRAARRRRRSSPRRATSARRRRRRERQPAWRSSDAAPSLMPPPPRAFARRSAPRPPSGAPPRASPPYRASFRASRRIRRRGSPCSRRRCRRP